MVNLRYEGNGKKFNSTKPVHDIEDTKYGHSFVQLAQYNKKPFVTGSFETLDSFNARTEIFENDQWKEVDSYPYGRLYVWFAFLISQFSYCLTRACSYPFRIY